MRKEFEVNHVTRSGRFYVITITERGVRGAVARQVSVHRNNMPRSDAVGGSHFTKFSGRVPIRGGYDGRHPHIVEGSFEQQGDVVSGKISIEVEPADATSATPSADDPDAFAILRPTRAT